MMKKRKSKIDRNIEKVRKSGLLSTDGMKVYEEDLKHLIIVLGEDEKVLNQISLPSKENAVSIFHFKNKQLKKHVLSRFINIDATKIINSWVCYGHDNKFKYRLTEVVY